MVWGKMEAFVPRQTLGWGEQLTRQTHPASSVNTLAGVLDVAKVTKFYSRAI